MKNVPTAIDCIAEPALDSRLGHELGEPAIIAGTPTLCDWVPAPRTSASDVTRRRRDDEVGLGVAAVDGEEHPRASATAASANAGRWAALASSRASSTSTARSHWRTSGLATSARSATSGSPVRAASDRQHLVRRHRLDQPEHLRRQRRTRAPAAVRRGPRAQAPRPPPRGQAVDGALVAHVHVVVRAVPGQQAGHQRGRGLAVVGAAALLEQRRLVVERRIRVHRQQLALDVEHPQCTVLAGDAGTAARGRCSRSSAGSRTGSRRAPASAPHGHTRSRRPAPPRAAPTAARAAGPPRRPRRTGSTTDG